MKFIKSTPSAVLTKLQIRFNFLFLQKLLGRYHEEKRKARFGADVLLAT